MRRLHASEALPYLLTSYGFLSLWKDYQDAKQEFPLCTVFQTNVNKIKEGTRREMPLECIEILHHSAAHRVFPSPVGID